MKSTLAVALDYAGRGWPVLPADPIGKYPCTAHGYKDASTDRAVIVGMSWGRADIGVATGAMFDVLDVDQHDQHSGDGFATLARLGIALPETLAASTPSGKGRHCYFRPLGLGIRVLGAELEWIGRGKIVVVPPARGREWLNDLPIAEAPPELVAAVSRRIHGLDWAGEENDSAKPFLKAPNDARDGIFDWSPTLNPRARFRAIVKWVERAQPGERNITLFRASCLMAMMCVEGPLKRRSVFDALMAAAWTNGLITKYGSEACKRTIASGFARVKSDLIAGRIPIPKGAGDLDRLLDASVPNSGGYDAPTSRVG
jgi:hypothetical protein